MTSMVANGMMDNDNYRYMKPVSEMSDVSEPQMRRGIDRASDRKGHDPLDAAAAAGVQASNRANGAALSESQSAATITAEFFKGFGVALGERTDLTAGQVYKCAISIITNGMDARFLSSSAVSSRVVPAPCQRRFLLSLVRFMRYFSGQHIASRTVIRLSDDLASHHLLQIPIDRLSIVFYNYSSQSVTGVYHGTYHLSIELSQKVTDKAEAL